MLKSTIVLIWMGLILSAGLRAQGDKGVQPGPAPTPVPGKRIALVIGNAKYQHGTPLKNPVNDAELMEQTLRELNFEVITKKNAALKEMVQAMNEFNDKIENGNHELALCYYSGHGLEVNGENYLMPVEANPARQSDVSFSCLNAQQILNGMEDARAKTKIMILDACRDNPLPKGWARSSGGGLAALPAPAGSLVAYATAPGKKAWDGDGLNSPYTAALARYLKEPSLDILQVFTQTAAATQDEAKRMGIEQVPYLSTSLRDRLVLLPIPTPIPLPDAPADNYYGPLVGKMILVHGGTFRMGCGADQLECEEDERPAHRVTISDYYLGETEVTQAQWQMVMGDNPSSNLGCKQCPVEQVSWDDIQEFLRRLNVQSGGTSYRLPTEAEWEYAARGGKNSRGYRYSGSNKLNDIGWYDSNSGGKTQVVRGKLSNELGLYDMIGNVWEWCSDWYGPYSSALQTDPVGASNGSYRVARGGSWVSNSAFCRVTLRDADSPVLRYNYLGFRLARTP